MKIIKLSGVLVIFFLPFLAEAELLWFDDLEQDTVGGPAQGWGTPGGAPHDTTWREGANTICGIIKDDFLVNDDTIGVCWHDFPAIAVAPSGNFVICWGDRRNGLYDPDIYAQRYSSLGDPLGTNFKVSDDSESGYQNEPSIAMNWDGDFVICWYDYRNGDSDVYAQRYSNSCDPLGANFRVNDDAGTSAQRTSSISMRADGEFVICWEDRRNGNFDIYAQRYSSSGDPLGTNFRVNNDDSGSSQRIPSIAMGADGEFVICWEDYRNGNLDIYAQRYSSLGDPLGTNFRANDDAGSSFQRIPSIAMGADGGVVICWEDYRNGNFDIYAQRYNSSGDPSGTNFRVNDDTGSSDQWIPSIAMSADGEFVICWEDYRNGDADIFAQRSHSDGTLWGANYIVNQRPNVFIPDQIEPSVALNDDRIAFAWMDARRSEVVYIHWDIYAKVVTWDWVKVDEPGDNDLGLPKSYALLQNYPNPFNVTTLILYSLPDRKGRPYRTDLKIFNILGEVVRTLVDEEQVPGDYEVLWNGKDDRGKEVGSGVYLCCLRCGIFSQTRKLVLVR